MMPRGVNVESRKSRSHSPRRRSKWAAAVAALALILAGIPAAGAQAAPGGPGLSDLARSGTASASRFQNNADGAFPAALAIDGKGSTEPVEANRTRWASGTEDDKSPTGIGGPVTYQVDLGAVANLDSVRLDWEASAAKSYTLATAESAPEDPASWTTKATVTDGTGGVIVSHSVAGTSARYVRLEMTEQIPNDWELQWGDGSTIHYYGYSLYSFEVWGVSSVTSLGFGNATSSVDAGSTATIPVTMNQPAATDTTVHVESADGTAIAGTDYTAVNTTVTIPAGSTTANVTSAIPAGANNGSFDVALSSPSSGVTLGAIATHTVNVKAKALPLPSVGGWVDYQNWEAPDAPTLENWGDTGGAGGNNPVVTLVPADRPGDKPASTQALQLKMPIGNSWGGVSGNISPAVSWKNYDAFRFWVKGHASNKSMKFELKNGNLTFKKTWVDDSTDWKTVELVFDEIRVDGNANARFDPKNMTGWGLDIGSYGNQALIFDDFELREIAGDVESFDHSPTISSAPSDSSIYSWGGPDTSENGPYPTLELAANDRAGAASANNMVLQGNYQIPDGSWGGVTQNFGSSQDWRLYKGLRFWWYSSMENEPASATAGEDIKLEIRNGGTAGTNAALFDAKFKDNWGKDAAGNSSRWKLVEIPFTSFQRRTDHQNNWANTDARPNLAAGWGWSLTFPAGTVQTAWKFDALQTYGVAASPDDVDVALTPAVSLVDAGDTATVAVSAVSADGAALAQDVTVGYATADGTAVAGLDYTAASGSVKFDAGTESGSTKTFEVDTTAATAAGTSKIIDINLTSATATASTEGRIIINAQGLAYLDSTKSNESRAADLLGRMTQAEKFGQMTQAERLGLSKTSDVSEYFLGSLLSGGGSVPADNTPAGWANMVDGFQLEALSTRLQIPMIYGVDAVHGHNNVVGATIFPHNIGLGASRNPEIVKEASRVTAQEVRATGIPWTFAPCLCVSVDERWGRSYEAFGEDPALVKLYARPAIEGLQGDDPSDISGSEEVLATAKHWVGDGGTTYGSGTGSYTLDQGVTNVADEAELMRLHVDPYLPALEAGVGSIMPSYSGVSINNGPVVRMHENADLNNRLLKGDLGFKGFLISDWEGIDKLPGGTYAQKAARSVNAGLDMAMAPYNYKAFIAAMQEARTNNTVTQARIDDAVLRILEQKFALGLFDQPFADRTNVDNVGSAANRQVARTAAAESQVLLKNSGGVLPLAEGTSVYVAGSSSNDLGRQMGGWSISWQGNGGATTTGTTIGAALKSVDPANVTLGTGTAAPSATYDVGIVVVGEKPYAEGVGDVGNTTSSGISMSLSAADKATIDNVEGKVGKLIVLVVSGRPQIISDQLSKIDALVASWLPGSEGDGVADVIYGELPFTGRLPVTWPATEASLPINVGDATYAPQFAYGWGLRTDSAKARVSALHAGLPSGAAKVTVARVLNADVWASDGSVNDAATALPLIQQAAAQLLGTDHWVKADALVSVARDIAQASVVAGTAVATNAKLTSDAEHQLLSGEAGAAVRMLASVASISLPTSGDLPAMLSNNAALAGITVGGKALSGFSAGTLTYKVELAADATVPEVGAVASDNEATVVVTAASAVPGVTKIVVTAADGVATKTYQISFVVKPGTVAKPFAKTGTVKVSGTARVGSKVKAVVSGTSPAPASVQYQWKRNGEAISKATKQTYKIASADIGKKITVTATLVRSGYKATPITAKAVAAKKATSKTTFKVKRVKVKGVTRARVYVTVKSTVKPAGKVVVKYGKKKVTVNLKASKKGKATVTLPRSAAGKQKVKVYFKGSKTVDKSASVTKRALLR